MRKKAYPEFFETLPYDGDEPLSEYPLTSKSDIREHPEMFTSRYIDRVESHHATTGGSTGTPFGFEISANHDPVHQEFLWDIMGYQKGTRSSV